MFGAMGLCLVVHCAALFSNSFIVAGRAVAHFLYTTLLLLWGVWGVCWWDNAGSPARERARGVAPSPRGQIEGQWCTARLVAVVSMMCLGRMALEYVALSHEKGAREAGDTSVRATLGLAFLIFAQESGGARKRSALAVCSRTISFMAKTSQKSLCIVSLYNTYSRALTFEKVCQCVFVFWALQLSQRLEGASRWLRLGVPRVAYLIALVELSSILAAAVRGRQVGQQAQVADSSAGSAMGARGTQSEVPAVGGEWGGGVVEPLNAVVESMVPVAALIFGADSAPVLGAAVAVLRLLPFVTDGHPEGQSLREMLVRRVI